jgi:hypothetical protein
MHESEELSSRKHIPEWDKQCSDEFLRLRHPHNKKQHKEQLEIFAEIRWRLGLRHEQLKELLTLRFDPHEDVDARDAPTAALPPLAAESGGESVGRYPTNLRAHHLAVTDLFIERALIYLERRADKYDKAGRHMQAYGFLVVSVGAIFAMARLLLNQGQLYQSQDSLWVPQLISDFTHSFALYAMMVAAAVGLWRYGKAMLDQAERLFERRHSLRQGWLFVHLNNGRLTIEQLDKAFNWNVSNANAFSSMAADVQAPWADIMKEFVGGMPEVMKEAVQTVAAQRKVGETKALEVSPRTSA